jgi:hypothetical protein
MLPDLVGRHRFFFELYALLREESKILRERAAGEAYRRQEARVLYKIATSQNDGAKGRCLSRTSQWQQSRHRCLC